MKLTHMASEMSGMCTFSKIISLSLAEWPIFPIQLRSICGLNGRTFQAAVYFNNRTDLQNLRHTLNHII